MDDALLHDLAAEQGALDELVADLDTAAWARPTPAKAWTVADQIHHLAVSEHAVALCLAGRHDEVWGADRSPWRTPRPSQPADVLASWRDTRAAALGAFVALDSSDRVVWGAGPMAVRSLASARVMETWAHGLDCHAALGTEPLDTERLRHVARLGHRALPYAFGLAGIDADPRQVRLDLTAPDGSRWHVGEPDAPEAIVGSAGEWCRVAVRRLDPHDSALVADGPVARAALAHARAYLAD